MFLVMCRALCVGLFSGDFGFLPADRAQVEGRGFAVHKGALPAPAAAVRRPPGVPRPRTGPAPPPGPAPLQQGLLRQRGLGYGGGVGVTRRTEPIVAHGGAGQILLIG